MKMNLQAEHIFISMILTRVDIEAKGNKEMAYSKVSWVLCVSLGRENTITSPITLAYP